MRSKGLSPFSLYALAVLSVVILLSLSDFDPPLASGLGELGEEPSELTLVVVASRPCTGGQVLNVTDGRGGQADAFCPLSAWPAAIEPGTVIETIVSRSSDDPAFLFVQSVEVLEQTGTKD